MTQNDMILSNVSIQKNESKWIVEWLSWMMIQGVDKFYIYNHESEDNTKEIYLQLSKKYDITIHDVYGNSCHYPMLQHYIDNCRKDCDWIMYNDTDEFMFPMEENKTVRDVLWEHWNVECSALAVHWMMFGSNGYNEMGRDIDLVTKDLTARSFETELQNRHVKSIIRGRNRGGMIQATNPHVYTTEFGTYNLKGKLLAPNIGWYKNDEPCFHKLRINHYQPKSYHWFKTIKTDRGYRFDRPDGPEQEVSDEYWWARNFNDVQDNSLWERWGEQMLSKMDEINSYLTIKPNMYSRLL